MVRLGGDAQVIGVNQSIHRGHVVSIELLDRGLGEAPSRRDQLGRFGRSIQAVRGIDAYDHAKPARAVIVREAELIVPDQGVGRAAREE